MHDDEFQLVCVSHDELPQPQPQSQQTMKHQQQQQLQRRQQQLHFERRSWHHDDVKTVEKVVGGDVVDVEEDEIVVVGAWSREGEEEEGTCRVGLYCRVGKSWRGVDDEVEFAENEMEGGVELTWHSKSSRWGYWVEDWKG